MRIRLLLNIGTNDAGRFPLLKEGEHEVSREDGLKLIERGWAVPIEPTAPVVKGIPVSPTVKAKESSEVKTTHAKPSRVNEPKSSAHKEQ